MTPIRRNSLHSHYCIIINIIRTEKVFRSAIKLKFRQLELDILIKNENSTNNIPNILMQAVEKNMFILKF